MYVAVLGRGLRVVRCGAVNLPEESHRWPLQPGLIAGFVFRGRQYTVLHMYNIFLTNNLIYE